MKLNFCMRLDIHERNKYYFVASSGCGQARQGMSKLRTNSDSVLFQE